MIRRRVSAAYLLRDGYTGLPMAAASVRCELDGRPCRPLWKGGGYLVFTDLSGGEHQITLSSRGYQTETLSFSVGSGAPAEDAVALKPGPEYPFHGEVTRLELALTAGGRALPGAEVWLAAPATAELKLAQELAGAGGTELRLFGRGTAALLPIPGPFLLSDGGGSEIVRLRALEGERALLAAPAARPHARGKRLLPAQPSRTGPDGTLDAVFHGAGRVEILAAGAYAVLELAAGENHLSLAL